MLRLSSCLLLAAVAAAQAPLPRHYREAGELRWGADAEGGAPFVFVDPGHPERGEVGFEVDLAQELGKLFGIKFRRAQEPYERLVEAVDRGDCDLVLNGFEPTPARRVQLRFTRPYYIYQQQLSVGPAITGVKGLADLVGKRVGVLGGSQSHQLLIAHPGVEAVVYESNVTAYEDVVNGRNAGSLADLPIARALRPQFPQLVDVGEPFGEFYYCMAVRRSEPELQRALDDAIAALLENGTLERIYRKWELWVPAEAKLADPSLAAMFTVGAAPAEIPIDWTVTLGMLGDGACNTLMLSFASFALAIALGLAIALARLHGPPTSRWCALAYVELFRGTPVLVQLYLLYFGLGQFEALQMTAMKAGMLGLALNYAAYEAEIYRGALAAIPRGQREAALALGLTGAQTQRHVVIPQALRLSLASSTNDFIALFKDSSIVSVISVVELSKQYSIRTQEVGHFILLGLVTAGFYLAMSLPLAALARHFEKKLDKDRA
jgi:polar amino acid transport system substrate-binding protein